MGEASTIVGAFFVLFWGTPILGGASSGVFRLWGLRAWKGSFSGLRGEGGAERRAFRGGGEDACVRRGRPSRCVGDVACGLLGALRRFVGASSGGSELNR